MAVHSQISTQVPIKNQDQQQFTAAASKHHYANVKPKIIFTKNKT